MIYMLLFKKVPMATWRSRKPQARHRVKYPRCCQWWLMSSSRLKFHERDFARRHRRRGEYSVCSGQAKSMKLHGFLSIQHFTRKEKKIDSWGDVWMIRGDRNRVAGSRPGVASCLAWSCGVHVANQTAWSCCTVTPCPCKTEQASNHLTDVKKIWAAIMQLRKQSEDKAKQAKLSPDALPTPSPDDACTISPIESPTISEKKEKNLQQC